MLSAGPGSSHTAQLCHGVLRMHEQGEKGMLSAAEGVLSREQRGRQHTQVAYGVQPAGEEFGVSECGWASFCGCGLCALQWVGWACAEVCVCLGGFLDCTCDQSCSKVLKLVGLERAVLARRRDSGKHLDAVDPPIAFLRPLKNASGYTSCWDWLAVPGPAPGGGWRSRADRHYVAVAPTSRWRINSSLCCCCVHVLCVCVPATMMGQGKHLSCLAWNGVGILRFCASPWDQL